jgi:hypothetical protein
MSRTLECDCCSYERCSQLTPTPMGIYRGDQNPPQKIFDLCDFCHNTLAANANAYPQQYPNADVLKTICWVANYLNEKMDTVLAART